MLISFPLLRKLQINSRQKWILTGIFCLPIISIIFAILRLVNTSATTHNVDPIQSQLYSMLEITSATMTFCLLSLRLFVVGTTPSGSSRYYSHSVADSSNADSGNAFYGTQKGTIPLETMAEVHNGHIVEEGSDEEDILGPSCLVTLVMAERM